MSLGALGRRQPRCSFDLRLVAPRTVAQYFSVIGAGQPAVLCPGHPSGLARWHPAAAAGAPRPGEDRGEAVGVDGPLGPELQSDSPLAFCEARTPDRRAPLPQFADLQFGPEGDGNAQSPSDRVYAKSLKCRLAQRVLEKVVLPVRRRLWGESHSLALDARNTGTRAAPPAPAVGMAEHCACCVP